MQFDFEGMSPAACFECLTGTVVPRPIALVTTVSVEGERSAAPYSFFNIMGTGDLFAMGRLAWAERSSAKDV